MKGSFVLGVSVMMIFSFGAYFVSAKKYVASVENYYSAKKEAFKILSQIESDFSLVAEEKTDGPSSQAVKQILKDYSPYSLEARDVSSGINAMLLDAGFGEECFGELIEKNPELKVEHGWINRTLYEALEKKGIYLDLPDFAIRESGMINENYISSEVKNAFFNEACKVMQKDEAERLFCKKTDFWQVDFVYEKAFRVTGILASFLDDDGKLCYRLEEKYFEKI